MSAYAASVANAIPVNQPSPDSLYSLVSRAKDGDGDAFTVLFEQHKKRVYSLCLLMTGNVAEAEDLTQDAFMQVFRKLKTFRGDSAFSTWLYRVAVNTVLMSLRKRKPRQVSLDEPISVEHSMVPRDLGRNDPGLSGAVDRIALARALQELPEGYRRIFILHEVEGYQHHEIATALGCSVGNSKSQLHKAKLRIRELLAGAPLTRECPSAADSPSCKARVLAFPGPSPSKPEYLRMRLLPRPV